MNVGMIKKFVDLPFGPLNRSEQCEAGKSCVRKCVSALYAYTW